MRSELLSASDRIEHRWEALREWLAREEATPLALLLEQVLEVPWTDPQAGEVRDALIARLKATGEYLEVGPGRWISAGRVPQPPARTRMPTVRVEHDAAVLVEAFEAWRELRDEEGHGGFTHRLSFAEIQMGFVRLGQHALSLLPRSAPAQVRLSLEDEETEAWLSLSPKPMLYGLEGWLWKHDPGSYLRFTRVGPSHLAVAVLERFDEAYYRSESRLFDLEALRALRRFGLPYRDHVRLVLARHPEGLSARALIDALEAELSFRPHPPTIRALLSSGAEFRVEDKRWRYVPTHAEPGWRPDYETATSWYERYGEALEARVPYRALLLTVGGSPEPLVFSLTQGRPEGACFVVSPGSAEVLPQVLAALPSPLAWHEVVTVQDHEALMEAVAACRTGFEKLLARGIGPKEVLVDFTGGTKAMSAAAVLATHTTGCGYSYVGGASRSKDNFGIVLNGAQVMRVVPSIR